MLQVVGASGEPALGHVTELHYTRAALNECLRLFPPGAEMPKFTDEPTTLGVYHIPAKVSGHEC